MKKNNTNKKVSITDYILFYSGGILAILAGSSIILLGELGRGIGDTIYTFNGLERLYGFWPIAIGAFFMWIPKIKKEIIEEEKEKEKPLD